MHIHRFYDFVVSIFAVHKGNVLLVRHKRYEEWLPLGGHVELDEDPLQALHREVKEESGLKVRILSETPRIAHPGVKPLPTPAYMDVHRIKGKHKHIAFVYFARAGSRAVRLHHREHYEFKWFNPAELGERRYALTRSIRFYCRQALRAASRV